MLLYTAALALEFAALITFRSREPELRGSFRIPLRGPALVVLAALPVLVLCVAVALEVRSRTIGLVGVLVAVAFGLAGPAAYAALRGPARAPDEDRA